MRNVIVGFMGKVSLPLFILLFISPLRPVLCNTTYSDEEIIGAEKISPTTVEIVLTNNQRITIDFYNEHIFRVFRDNSGGIIRDPEAVPAARILADQPRKPINDIALTDENDFISISSEKIIIRLNKKESLIQVINKKHNKIVLEEVQPATFEKGKTTLSLKESTDEYFYGGGVQNGRFSHKGKIIAIENQNSWTDGGVASPTPFYWSTNGYGILWHTFKKGKYDFGAGEKGIVRLYHEIAYLDLFCMVNDGASALLNDFYQLTGNPVLLPKFGFYQGHLNAYNRDYWKEDESGILFEDGKRYKESQKDNGGIKESLNGENNNYQFSARAVIDRYKLHDMPFGWILPNDGYGAGYGQTESLEGNIANLKELGNYAHRNGVEIGLWTQSDLYPKPGINALLQRDIIKEVRDAGVRVLKTDVAWVGAGYSFGLNGVSDVARIMTHYGNNNRPFIISLDGWAGTQRYAGIWSGDQTGGVWEYIRFHIPTYIGSGLSGQPNITSDMDGIFGGKNPVVNTRDFQWKCFTPMELNMDGWGANEKYPHALGEPTTSINRWYLKLKSELMPYAYTIAKEAVSGLPMIRAMFLEYPNPHTLGKATQYQFMYGPYFLVAPIYQETRRDILGNDIRNNIYLPEGTWFDYFTGDKYEGNCIINHFEAPIWKLPVFVKHGAIIPLTHPNNNVSEINPSVRIYEFYPNTYNTFTEYDDDGVTEEYKTGKGTTTRIEAGVNHKNKLTINIHPTSGDFNGFVKEKSTELRINVTEKPRKLSVNIGGNNIKLKEVHTLSEFMQGENVFFFEKAPDLNRFATPGSEFEKKVITKNPLFRVKLQATDITTKRINLYLDGFSFNPADKNRVTSGILSAPKNAGVMDKDREAYTLKPSWEHVKNADYYEIDFNGMHYTTIKDNELLFEDLKEETTYTFNIRAVNKDGYSEWSEFSATTKANPLEFAIQGISGETTVENQGGQGIKNLFDFDENNIWHTTWSKQAIPFDLVMDLKTINQLDKFHYLPRSGGGNGNLIKGDVYYSSDKENWEKAGSFEWAKNDDTKLFVFTENPSARYIRITATEGIGGFGSGRELYVFKVAGTESYLPGDINNDGSIDRNDLVSYTNYTGLRRGDADFEGYISTGDINKNGLIDAYDISIVTTQLEGGVSKRNNAEQPKGNILLETEKRTYDKGEIIEIIVKGIDLRSVNALSFALPYDPQDYEFEGIVPLNIKAMENLTNDRLHSNGTKALYPTFVNVGDKATLEGSNNLFILKMKARRKLNFKLKAIDGLLVSKTLHCLHF